MFVLDESFDLEIKWKTSCHRKATSCRCLILLMMFSIEKHSSYMITAQICLKSAILRQTALIVFLHKWEALCLPKRAYGNSR
jgi:hypothetical protein